MFSGSHHGLELGKKGVFLSVNRDKSVSILRLSHLAITGVIVGTFLIFLRDVNDWDSTGIYIAALFFTILLELGLLGLISGSLKARNFRKHAAEVTGTVVAIKEKSDLDDKSWKYQVVHYRDFKGQKIENWFRLKDGDYVPQLEEKITLLIHENYPEFACENDIWKVYKGVGTMAFLIGIALAGLLICWATTL